MYATIKKGIRAEDCDFYHRLDILGMERFRYQWDLVDKETKYLGGVDFAGKRVLEFGPASGWLTFWMERQGAEVVSVDLSSDTTRHSWDVLWHPGLDPREIHKNMAHAMTRLNNSWWFAREQFYGKAQMVHSTAYDTPIDLGPFDVVTFGSILLHLRDPLRALENGLKFQPKSVVVTDRLPAHLSKEEMERPLAVFLGSAASVGKHGGLTWWHLSPKLITKYLDAMGYKTVYNKVESYNYSGPPIRPTDLFTIVAERR